MVQRVIVETEQQLVLRNQEKLEQAKQALGGRYVLHPSNAVTRQETPRTAAARIRKPIQAAPRPTPESLVVRRSS